MEDFCKRLPKVELHAHLNGSISDATIGKLLLDKKEKNPSWQPDPKWAVTIDKGQQRNLQDVFVMFGLLHELCITEDHAYMVTVDVITEFAADNVKYLELRTTPRDNADTGMTKMSYVQAVVRGIQHCHADTSLDISVRLLLAIDRRVSVTEASEVVELASRLQRETTGIVVGVDLSGDPNKGDISQFIPVLQDARRQGLKLAIHLAEVASGGDETVAVLESVIPDRIGHGVFLHPEVGGSQQMVDIVQRHRVPIEICLTSNLKTGTVGRLSDHHLGYWLHRQHPLAVSTDDKGVFSTSLSEEFLLAAQTFSLNKQDLWRLSYDAIDYAFVTEDTKQLIRQKWRNVEDDLLGS